MAAEGRAGAGSFGPRLAGRLTAELISRSPQYMSCVGYYEIDMRGGVRALLVACDGWQLATLLLPFAGVTNPHVNLAQDIKSRLSRTWEPPR